MKSTLWCSIVGATVTVHQFFCILHFCHTCSLCRVELVVQFPARGSTQVLLCLLPGVLWLWHFLYSVVPHPVSSLHIYTFVVLRTFMAGAASQAGDADSSRAPGLTSGLQGSVNLHRGALLLVPQWQCISSFVFYIGMDEVLKVPYKCCFLARSASRAGQKYVTGVPFFNKLLLQTGRLQQQTECIAAI